MRTYLSRHAARPLATTPARSDHPILLLLQLLRAVGQLSSFSLENLGDALPPRRLLFPIRGGIGYVLAVCQGLEHLLGHLWHMCLVVVGRRL